VIGRSASQRVDLEGVRPESQWYAMLFPSVEESEELAARLAKLAELTGGTANPSVHVTVGYFAGDADPETVVDLARRLDRPAITLRAAGLFSWSEERHPTIGYYLSLQVIRDDAVREWQRRALEALSGAGLHPAIPWDVQNPHMMVLSDLPAPPAEVLVRLGSTDFRLEFRAVRLVVSQRVGDEFVTLLDQPLVD
jgi:2'-5' RNA ligase